MAYARKPAEERVATIDKKIDSLKQRIAADQIKITDLEKKKENILNPQPRKRKVTATAIINKAKEAGLTDAEIAAKLGIEL